MFSILVIISSLPLWAIASNNSTDLKWVRGSTCHPLMYCDPYFSLAGFAKVSWLEANHICNRVGSVLATVRNEDQHQLMLDYAIRNEKYFGNLSFWLGATNLVERSYRWTWLSSGIPVTFAQWAAREPRSDRTGRDACLILDSDHRWHSAACNEKHFFICENICYLPGLSDSSGNLVGGLPMATSGLQAPHPLYMQPQASLNGSSYQFHDLAANQIYSDVTSVRSLASIGIGSTDG